MVAVAVRVVEMALSSFGDCDMMMVYDDGDDVDGGGGSEGGGNGAWERSNEDDSRQGDDVKLKILGTQSQKTMAQDQDHRSIKEQRHYKQEKTKTKDRRRQSSKSNEDNLYNGGDC
ncbi:hypothetical protein Tco_0882738, partial [Tanacetum coccineum]